MDVVDRIANVATGAVGPFGAEAPLTPVVLTRATVVGESPAARPAPPAAPPATEAAAAPDVAGSEREAGAARPGGDAAGSAAEPPPQP
jgi:hypothetical protein